MRKVILTVCAIGLVAAAFSAAASASEQSWITFIMAAGGGTDAASAQLSGSEAWAASSTSAPRTGEPIVQDDPAIQDGRDSTNGLPPPTAPGAYAAWYRPTWAGETAAYGKVFARDYHDPIQPDKLIERWGDLIVWASDGYTPENILLFISASGVPASIGGQAMGYSLQLENAPAGYSGPSFWTLPTPPPAGTAKTHWLTITLPAAGAIGTMPITGSGAIGAGATQNVGYRFSFVTPEPGSIAVLASGLAGLVGFVSRRRKA